MAEDSASEAFHKETTLGLDSDLDTPSKFSVTLGPPKSIRGIAGNLPARFSASIPFRM